MKNLLLFKKENFFHVGVFFFEIGPHLLGGLSPSKRSKTSLDNYKQT
jgi:hypothetical protein